MRLPEALKRLRALGIRLEGCRYVAVFVDDAFMEDDGAHQGLARVSAGFDPCVLNLKDQITAEGRDRLNKVLEADVLGQSRFQLRQRSTVDARLFGSALLREALNAPQLDKLMAEVQLE